MSSKATQKNRGKYYVTRIIDILITIGPVLGFLIYGFITAEPRYKIGLTAVVLVAVLIGVVNILFKYHLRSVPWIIAFGLAFAIKDLMPFLITMGVTTIADEFIFHPLAKHYKATLIVNKEMDKRLNE